MQYTNMIIDTIVAQVNAHKDFHHSLCRKYPRVVRPLFQPYRSHLLENNMCH